MNVCGGVTNSNWKLSASFSYASSTSPLPCRKTSVASRPESGTQLDVLGDELGDEVDSGPRILAAVARERVGRQQVPLGRTRAQWAGRDDLDTRLQQIVPVADVLGIALRAPRCSPPSRRNALVRARVPVLVDLARLDEPGDIRFDREVDDIGRLTRLDAAGLITGGTVRAVTSTPLPSSVAANAGATFDQPGSGTAYAIRVRVVSAFPLPASSPATSLAPPPHAASRLAERASAAAVRHLDVDFRIFCIDDLSGSAFGWASVPERWRDRRIYCRQLRHSHPRHQTANGQGVSDNNNNRCQKRHSNPRQ